MDRGFYSKENIDALYQNHLKFLMATKVSLKYVQEELDKVRDSTRAYYNASYQLYSHTAVIDWEYSQKRPYRGDVIEGKRRMYLHIYFSGEKALEHENLFNAFLDRLEAELVSGNRKAKKDYGFFALISNEIKDPIAALDLYRNKDIVEIAFGNLKERLNLRRTAVSSESSLEGKLFVQFIALIYLSYIKKQMYEKELYKNYTMQELLDELDVIEAFENPGSALRVGEVTKKQSQLYNTLGVVPPDHVIIFWESRLYIFEL
jgi:transposase